MFSSDLEGHAPSWPPIPRQRTRPQRVPPPAPFGCGHTRRQCPGGTQHLRGQ